MTQWIYIDLMILACVVLITGFIIPQILLIAFRKNLFDTPDSRKIHTSQVPRLGGIAFFPAILFALLLLFGIGVLYDDQSILVRLHNHILPLCFIGCAAIILYLTGMADDLVGVKYRAKFVMQTFAAAMIIIGELRIENLHGFLGIYALPLVVSVILTALLTIFIINAINLIDGIDGLASGLSAVACGFYAIIFLKSGMFMYSALAVATLGTLLPFFSFNVFGNAQKHKKIFMGDTGALIIGLFLSVMSIESCSIDWLEHNTNPAVLAFAPLLIPCFDVVRVYLHRIKAHRNPFLPDKTHIHHKLLALGLTQRKAMMTIIASSIFIIWVNYVMSSRMDITLLFFCDITLWIVINIILTRSVHSRENRLNCKLYD